LTLVGSAAIEKRLVRAGQFVISLDFELHWGVRDHTSVDAYRENLLGVRTVIPALLARFRQREIHATWATVGILFARSRDEALTHAPATRPSYADSRLDAYAELAAAGATEEEDPFHFAGSLTEQIASTPHQELATHTFSHFYCLENGPTIEAFEADLKSAKAIGSRLGEVTRSIVFPRNQYDRAHLDALHRAGTIAFRGNPQASFWQPAAAADETLSRRALRFVDSYGTTGRTQVAKVARHPSGLVDVPATRFLRPWTPALSRLEPLKLMRIRNEMRQAAASGGLFHLWWHPHNFGRHPVQNLASLDRVLDVFDELRGSCGMQSQTMAEAAQAAA
jgi:peptidoglycan/xylan/chitin deacetylase (PgdA/CDA1 family)